MFYRVVVSFVSFLCYFPLSHELKISSFSYVSSPFPLFSSILIFLYGQVCVLLVGGCSPGVFLSSSSF